MAHIIEHKELLECPISRKGNRYLSLARSFYSKPHSRSHVSFGLTGSKSGSKNASDDGSMRSVMTIAFQFVFESHMQENIASTARHYVRGLRWLFILHILALPLGFVLHSLPLKRIHWLTGSAKAKAIADVVGGSTEDYEVGMRSCAEAAIVWMQVPVPKRGDIVNKLQEFGRLVSLEMGKILHEGIVEVQVHFILDV